MIQTAFYCHGENVTSKPVLKLIAAKLGVAEDKFNELFESPRIIRATQQHFQATYQAGIRGFPALVWQDGDKVERLCNGYVPFDQLSEDIDRRLKHNL